ncbi:MAG: outer membrane lipoprotein carrier protein LolA [bacterium P3]|nr:MAG: outer membrane lipoprotein carrier protein LolA [bacterium P3]KWW42106.1 MAG: outer membrane lipoprotein carrier protein LolA [bacterium F083]
MKHFISLLILLLAVVAATAQITHTATGGVDQGAQKVLRKAAAFFDGKPVSFTVTMVNYNTKKTETARATAQVLYSRGRYRVTAPQQVLYCDGKSVWHWNQEAGEVVVNTLSAEEDNLLNPAHLLSTYEQSFRPKYIRTEADGTAIVDLQPKKSKSYHKLRLAIAEKSGQLQRMEIHNYDGSRGEYRITGVKTGVRCSDPDFVFDTAAHRGVEIIDMR